MISICFTSVPSCKMGTWLGEWTNQLAMPTQPHTILHTKVCMQVYAHTHKLPHLCTARWSIGSQRHTPRTWMTQDPCTSPNKTCHKLEEKKTKQITKKNNIKAPSSSFPPFIPSFLPPVRPSLPPFHLLSLPPFHLLSLPPLSPSPLHL